MSSVGNAAALCFLPMPTLKEAGRCQARPVDVIEAARVDGNPVWL